MENKSNAKFKTLDLVEVGVMAAIIFAGTYLNIPIYIGGGRSMIHLGTAVVFISVLILGKNKSALSSAVGLSLYDLLSPFAIFAPFTFLVKGGMAYIAGAFAYRKDYNGNNTLNNIFAFTLGGIFNIVGYYLTDAIIYKSFAIALVHVPSSVITTAIGIIVAAPFGRVIKKAMRR